MKSPWALIGWLVAGLLALLISIGLYFGSLALGWKPWLAPLLLWFPLLIAGFLKLFMWLLARPKLPPAPILDPSNPFTGQWEAIKSGLSGGPWELYLAVGDNDESKKKFLYQALGETEYIASPAGMDGLSLLAADGRAWLNVPASLWYEQVRNDSLSAPSGDWGHLLKLLPSFPGRLSGLLILLDPKKLTADPETQGKIVCKKLRGLSKLPGVSALWWLVLHPLENIPSGKKLEESFAKMADHKNEMWQRPFGYFFQNNNASKLTLSQQMVKAQSSIAESLNEDLNKTDYWATMPQLSDQIFSFMDNFKHIPLDFFSGEVASNNNQRKIKCDGLFLTLNSLSCGGQFNKMLINLLPQRLSRQNDITLKRYSRLIMVGVFAFFLITLVCLGFGYWHASQTLIIAGNIHPILNDLRNNSTSYSPITTLAVATDLTLKLEKTAQGLATIYTAPEKAVLNVRSSMVSQLNKYIPRKYSDYKPFISAITNWADENSPSISFQHSNTTITVPGFATIAGRSQVIELIEKWNLLLDFEQKYELDSAIKLYELYFFEAWQSKAYEMAELAEPKPENVKQAGLNGLQGEYVSLDFLVSAGTELSFISDQKIPDWVALVRDIKMLDSLSDMGDFSDDHHELSSILKRIHIRRSPLGSEGIGNVIKAAKTWKNYESAVHDLSGLAESPKGLSSLAEEMFSGSQPPKDRVSITGLSQLCDESFKSLLNISKINSANDRELIEKLFKSPVEWFTKSSISAAASSLDDEWNRKILLPSKDLSEIEKVALLLGEDGAVAAFRNGPARHYLVADKKGFKPNEVFGQTFPWSKDFLVFINANQEGWKKMASSDGRLHVTANLRPVRAEGSQLINHPIGMTFQMPCEADQFKAESYNQPTQFIASWSPKNCDPLNITIAFRDFKLIKTYEGSAGFTNFIKEAVRGELRYTPDDFPDQKHLMKAAGAEFVVISLDVAKGKEILKALTTPVQTLKPPAIIISTN